MENAWHCLQLDHLATHLGSRSFVQRDANNSETVLFTMFFAFVLHGHKSYQCNISWPVAHEADRWTFWTSCSGFMETPILVHNAQLLVQLAYGEGNLGWTTSAHRYGKNTENIIFWVFLVFFLPGYIVNKRQEEPLCTCFRNTKVHETEMCIFWTSQTFVSLKLCFQCIMHEFEHSLIT